MIRKLAFDELVDAIEGLSFDEQAELVHLIRRRLAETGRKRVIAEVAEARSDVASRKAASLSLETLARDLRE